MALFNPEEDAGIFIPRELDGSEGRAVFSAAPPPAERNGTSAIPGAFRRQTFSPNGGGKQGALNSIRKT
jgi:hypothetical protein